MQFLWKAIYVGVAAAVAGCGAVAPGEIPVPKDVKTEHAVVKELREEIITSTPYVPPVYTGSYTQNAAINATQRVAASSQKTTIARYRAVLVTKSGKQIIFPDQSSQAMDHAAGARYQVGICYDVTYSDENPRYIRTEFVMCN